MIAAPIGFRLLLAVAAATCCGCDVGGAKPQGQQSAAPYRLVGRVAFLSNYQQAYQQANQSKRPLLVFFTFERCGYCQQMKAEAFTDGAVAALAEQFVCVEVDLDREPAVCNAFRIDAYPTVQFLAPDGASLRRLTGKKAANELVVEMAPPSSRPPAMRCVPLREAGDDRGFGMACSPCVD